MERLFRVNKHVIFLIWLHSLFFVSVMETINTGIDVITSITLLSGNTAVISGYEAGIRKVKSYNLQTGAELSCLNLKDASGVARVKLGGKLVLAVLRRLVKRAIGFIIAILLFTSSNVNII